ncbi:MAG TPA: SMP-30/gluconolactonase/LRE family protein [Terracidiphilus sp.]|nr:SMP-30/gluconolactonase/LRE family protein [Terracidiphilus sp.]
MVNLRDRDSKFFPLPHQSVVPFSAMAVFADGLDHPEGLVFDADGNLWAGGEAGQIYKVPPDGRPELIVTLGGFNLGLCFSPAQELYACNFMHRAVIRVDRRGTLIENICEFAGQPLVHPNFALFDRSGTLYVSDSGHWGASDGWVYRRFADGKSERFAGPFDFANGLALSAAEDRLFVVESTLDRVSSVAIEADGRAGKREIYASGLERVPDGLALDSAGNLYVTCYASDCLYRVLPDRSVELFAHDPEGVVLARPTNAAFGGRDGTDLYVANLGRWHITRFPTQNQGQPLAHQPAHTRDRQ